MHRRRSAATVSTAAALLVAAPLLAGCGGETHPGAAAVVDGERISLSTLQSRVNAVRDAQRELPRGEQAIQRSGQLTRATLDGMIRHEVVKAAAEKAGVSITRREVQQQRDQYEKRAGGSRAFERVLLLQQGIAPSATDDWVWLNVAVQEIAKAKGIDPTTPKGNKALGEKLSSISAGMDIDVNPRYGKWDAERGGLAHSDVAWLNNVSREAALEQQRVA